MDTLITILLSLIIAIPIATLIIFIYEKLTAKKKPLTCQENESVSSLLV